MNAILATDVEGAQQLRAQLPYASVVATWGAGSPSVDLEVDARAHPADLPDGEVPASAVVTDERGRYVGEITLWVTGGYLSAIEYGWVTDERPDTLPPLSWLTPA